MNHKSLAISLALLSLCSQLLAAEPDKSMAKVIDKGLGRAASQAMMMYGQVKDKGDACFPTSCTPEGELKFAKSSDWTSGFFPGELWYLYEYSADESLKAAAEDMTLRISPEQYNTRSHDVGFMVNCSFGNAYRLTGNQAYRDVLINAANSLATRFNQNIGCTRSWNRKTEGWQYIVIIDNMMNLELLTVGSGLTTDPHCYEVAVSHANTTMRNHFREDGSSYHAVDYDTLSFRPAQKRTFQGLADDSSWSRGQSWGLYGFTMMYRQTGRAEYLAHARKVASYLMHHPNMPKDKIPYWDFNAPARKDTPRDASAAAIMASALIELSGYVADDAESSAMLRYAEGILRSLTSGKYLAASGRNGGFALLHSTAYMAKNRDVDAPLSYADYYYVEALVRYSKLLKGEPAVDILTLYSENPQRAKWLSALDRVSTPLLGAMSKGQLKAKMPVESNNTDIASRYKCTYLEALGRLIEGIAPWIENGPQDGPEGLLRAKYQKLALESISNGVNPESPDYLNFNDGRQPLVDAAFLAHGLLRAPEQLWGKLGAETQHRLIAEMKSTRVIKPSESNWLFFSAMVEAFLYEVTGEWEFDRVEYALSRHKEWFKGDAQYGDGENFHLDYYNSFVIQPMMMQVLDIMKKHGVQGYEFLDVQTRRYTRYAEQLERFISPEGTYPIVGRSIAYRFGAFQALSDAAYRHLLSEKLHPAQVRCALTAVIDRQINAPQTFDGNGWLQIGIYGHQPSIGERYISTGSLYLCSAAFIALGLPSDDPFWADPDEPWTNKKVWMGLEIPIDKALSNQ